MLGVRCIVKRAKCLVSGALLREQSAWCQVRCEESKVLGVRCIMEKAKC